MINKTEFEILERWQGRIEHPVVSICCTTYNHEKYISDALDGFLMQETDFPFEVIIRDDASLDNTSKIIKMYEDKFPAIIKPIYEIENGFQKGIKPLATAVWNARGQYIAICEGDDYWIDTQKLQKQVTLLDKNPNIHFCFHKAKILNIITQESYDHHCYIDHDGIISANDIIATLDKLMVPTASIMIRANVTSEVCNYIKQRPWLSVGDFYFRIFGVANGGALYINSAMSVYRYFTSGSWTTSYINNQSIKINHAQNAISSFRELNKLFDYEFNKEFKIVTNSMATGILTDQKISFMRKLNFFFTIFKITPYKISIKQASTLFFMILKSHVRKYKFTTLTINYIRKKL